MVEPREPPAAGHRTRSRARTYVRRNAQNRQRQPNGRRTEIQRHNVTGSYPDADAPLGSSNAKITSTIGFQTMTAVHASTTQVPWILGQSNSFRPPPPEFLQGDDHQ